MLKGNGWDRVVEAFEASDKLLVSQIEDVTDDGLNGKLDVIIEKLDEIRFLLWDKETTK